MCQVLKVSRSAFYDWFKKPESQPYVAQKVLESRCKALFKASRQSLGSRQMMQHLRREGFKIGRYKTRSLMNKLGLVVKQRRKSPYRSLNPKQKLKKS